MKQIFLWQSMTGLAQISMDYKRARAFSIRRGAARLQRSSQGRNLSPREPTPQGDSLSTLIWLKSARFYLKLANFNPMTVSLVIRIAQNPRFFLLWKIFNFQRSSILFSWTQRTWQPISRAKPIGRRRKFLGTHNWKVFWMVVRFLTRSQEAQSSVIWILVYAQMQEIKFMKLCKKVPANAVNSVVVWSWLEQKQPQRSHFSSPIEAAWSRSTRKVPTSAALRAQTPWQTAQSIRKLSKTLKDSILFIQRNHLCLPESTTQECIQVFIKKKKRTGKNTKSWKLGLEVCNPTTKPEQTALDMISTTCMERKHMKWFAILRDTLGNSRHKLSLKAWRNSSKKNKGRWKLQKRKKKKVLVNC